MITPASLTSLVYCAVTLSNSVGCPINRYSIVRFIVLPILLALHHLIDKSRFVDKETTMALLKSRVITHVPRLLILPRLHLLLQLDQFNTTNIQLCQDVEVLLLDILPEILLFFHLKITIV